MMDRPLLGSWKDDYVLSTEINFSGNSPSLPSSEDVSPLFDNFRSVCSFPAQTIVPSRDYARTQSQRSNSSVTDTRTTVSPSSSCQTSLSTATDPSFDKVTSWLLNSVFSDQRQDTYTRQISSTVSPNSSSQTVSTPVSTRDSRQPLDWSLYLGSPTNSQTQSPLNTFFKPADIAYSSGEDISTYLLAPTTQPPKHTESAVSLQTTDGLHNSKTNENHVCSQDVVFVAEVQKPELDKSTDIMFVRENYNRSDVVCLTPNRKSRRKKTPYTKRVTDGDTTEFKVTISQRKDSLSAVAPTSVWNYLMASGLQTFDPKTTSLLEHLYHSGAHSNSSITVTLPGTADTYEINMQTMQMKNTLNGEEIVLFRRPIVIDDSELPNSGLSDFPSHWSPQENDIQVVPIYCTLDSSEWDTIESAMKRTLPKLRIHSIERVQNKKLWIRYAFQKAMLMDKNGLGTDVNEKLLFHGTRDNPPYKIWQSEDGFDMRYCKRGAWGLGTYFAQEASYSDNYAHRPMPHTPLRQMVVASVLTGYSKETLSDVTLRRPPVRIPATSRNPEVLYDSVTGISGNSRIYILYKFDMAYPSYLVTYSA